MSLIATRTTKLWVVPNLAEPSVPPELFAAPGLAEAAYHRAYVEGNTGVLAPVEVVVVTKKDHRGMVWWMLGLWVMIGLGIWHDSHHDGAGHHQTGTREVRTNP